VGARDFPVRDFFRWTDIDHVLIDSKSKSGRVSDNFKFESGALEERKTRERRHYLSSPIA
jgi:hypothetical protein